MDGAADAASIPFESDAMSIADEAGRRDPKLRPCRREPGPGTRRNPGLGCARSRGFPQPCREARVTDALGSPRGTEP